MAKKLVLTILAGGILLTVTSVASLGGDADGTIEALLSRGDHLWSQAPDLDKLEESIEVYGEVLDVSPGHYEACWKIARSCFAIADLLPGTKEMKKRREELGKLGMGFGEQAFKLKPEGIEGHYYYVLALGQYSLSINVIKALAKGLGPKYERHIGKVLAMDRGFDKGGALRAIGRYWYSLPWPKRDVTKSIAYLDESIRVAPQSVRGRVYLAESYLKAGKREEARAALEAALRAVPDTSIEYDAARWKERAGELLSKRFR